MTKDNIAASPFLGDLVFRGNQGIVTHYPVYSVVQTPSNPGYYWGNYIQLQSADIKDIPALEDLYRREIPVSSKFVFAVDDDVSCSRTNGDLRTRFEAAGYEYEPFCCLVAAATELIAVTDAIEVRTIVSEDDWKQALANQLLCRNGDAAHIVGRMASARKAVAEGNGFWLGAFKNDLLVGDLGLLWKDNLCRFRAIGTHPAHRRQGVASQMITAAVKIAADAGHRDALFIIMTGLGSAQQAFYEKLGFRHVSTHVGFLDKHARKAPSQ